MKGVNMRYQISGKQIDIGMALQQHVKGEIDDVVSKYAERPTDAIIVFLKVVTSLYVKLLFIYRRV